MISSNETAQKQWFNRRVEAVTAVYSAYMALIENGVEIPDESTSVQIFCPFHDNKNTPAARYYSSSGREKSHFFCFKCKINLNGIGLFARFHNLKFTDALSKLERRFHIVVPKLEEPILDVFKDKGENYKSEAWLDIPRHLAILEKKLSRTRSVAPFVDYVKICRVLDRVAWDFDKTGTPTKDMIIILKKASEKLDKMISESNEFI